MTLPTDGRSPRWMQATYEGGSQGDSASVCNQPINDSNGKEMGTVGMRIPFARSTCGKTVVGGLERTTAEAGT